MPTKKTGAALPIVALGVLALLAACAAPTEKVATPGAGTPIVLPTATALPPEAKPIGGGTLRSYMTQDPPYWDPFMGVSGETSSHINRITAPLLQFHYGRGVDRWNFDISNQGLAEKWEVSADSLSWTFHIRQGVRWQNKPPVNGREFVAEDVKWSLEYHMATAGAPRREQLAAAIESVSCPDKYTVVIKTKRPAADLIYLLASPYVPMYAQECLKEFGTLNTTKAVIGVGPFLLDEITPSVVTKIKKNPTYYRAAEGLPYLDGIRYTVIPDASTSLAAFRAEQVDIRGISRIDLASVQETNPNIYCYEGEVSLTQAAICFQTSKLPFSDVRLRQAVSMALNRQEVIDTFYYGYGITQEGPIHGSSPWYLTPEKQGECNKYFKYDVEAAKKLVAEAGYPNGLSVSLHVNSGWGATYMEYAEYLVDVLEKIGIKATLKTMDTAAFYATVYSKHDYPDLTFLYKWGGATFAPDSWVVQMYRPGYVSNYSNVDDPELEKLLVVQEQELDPVKRQKVLDDIQRYEACAMHYVHWPMAWGVTCQQPWVRDYYVHAVTYHSGRIAELIWLTPDAPGRRL